MFLLACFQRMTADICSHTSGAGILQANPIHRVHVLDFLSVHVTVVPEIQAAAAIWHKLVWNV